MSVMKRWSCQIGIPVEPSALMERRDRTNVVFIMS